MVKKRMQTWDNLLKPTYSFIKSFYFMIMHVFQENIYGHFLEVFFLTMEMKFVFIIKLL